MKLYSFYSFARIHLLPEAKFGEDPLMLELFLPINLSNVINPNIEKNYTFSPYGIINLHCLGDKNYL